MDLTTTQLPPEALHLTSAHLGARTERMRAVPAGLAVIPIYGWLTPRCSLLEAWGVVTSYEGLHAQLNQALADPAIQQIVLDIDSTGGAATGAFELADALFAARAVKPITAIAHFTACSSAYLLAAATNRIVVSATSAVGSIGVRADHVDQSKCDDMAGMKVTTVSVGAHKNDLTPHEPLSEQSFATLTARIQNLYQMFVRAIARYRSGLTEQAVRETEAAVYVGDEAVEQGLADEFASPQGVIDRLAAQVGATLTPRPQHVRYRARAMQMRSVL